MDSKLNTNMTCAVSNREKIYEVAKSCLGQVLSYGNSNYGCAITVCEILDKAGISINKTFSTYILYAELKSSTSFQDVVEPLFGDIIISPTGYGNGNLSNGHVGIVGKYGIISNSSEDGKVHENFTLDSWKKIYSEIGGFPVSFFRVV